MPNPFLVKGQPIDKRSIAEALAEVQRVTKECQDFTEKAMRDTSFDTELQWAMSLSNAEITLSNIVDLFRKRFV